MHENVVSVFNWREVIYGQAEDLVINNHLKPLPPDFDNIPVTGLICLDEKQKHVVHPNVSQFLDELELDNKVAFSVGLKTRLGQTVEQTIVALAQKYTIVPEENIPKVADFRGYHFDEMRPHFSKRGTAILTLLFKPPKI